MVHPNGTFYLVCDSNELLSAPSVEGPWVHVAHIGGFNPPGPVGGYEDAFIWLDPRGAWHILFHVWSNVPEPVCYNTTVSAHAFSENGLEWWVGAVQPYGTVINFADGSSTTTPTRERPKLVFGADGEPTHLFNGVVDNMPVCPPWWCSHCKQVANHTYTLVVPLG